MAVKLPVIRMRSFFIIWVNRVGTVLELWLGEWEGYAVGDDLEGFGRQN
jgi:hypothetical protein